MSNKRKRNTGLALLAGLAAGVGAGLWLNSKKGRKWRKNTAQVAEEKWENVSSTVTDAVDQGKEYAGNVKSTVSNYASTAADAFQAGIKHARETMKEGLAEKN